MSSDTPVSLKDRALPELGTKAIDAASTIGRIGRSSEIDQHSDRGIHFWLVYVALCISLLLAALDLVSLHGCSSSISSLLVYRHPLLPQRPPL